MNRVGVLMAAIAGALAGGAIALAVATGSTTSGRSSTTTVVQPGQRIPTALANGHALSVSQIYRQASPGAVDIKVTLNSSSGSGGLGVPGFGGSQPQGAEGAGVVYDSKGDILTDEHVVSGATSVKVIFQNGKTVSAKVLGTDPSTDVGVIHVDVPASQLHPVPFADSNAAQVGDPVVAIGSPFFLPGTTTAGIVSAVGRSIPAPNQYTIAGAIQTDAAINEGNSGGPLLDANGHVLGLVDQIQTNSGSNAGVGFATPSNTVARMADAIIGGKPVKHSYVGVTLNSNASSGAQITSVQGGSPASSAGLQQGDVVTAINGKPINSTGEFIGTIDTHSPDDTVTLSVKRGGSTREIKVKLGTRPNQAPNG